MDTTKKEDEQKKVLRCQADDCKKKLGLLGFVCRCEKHFCAVHRVSDAHKCTFDFREQQKKDLLKYMSTAIRAEKVEAI
jgi:hypothetical protein